MDRDPIRIDLVMKENPISRGGGQKLNSFLHYLKNNKNYYLQKNIPSYPIIEFIDENADKRDKKYNIYYQGKGSFTGVFGIRIIENEIQYSNIAIYH